LRLISIHTTRSILIRAIISTKDKSRKSEKPTAWSELTWDAGRNQWGRYRVFRGEYEYEWARHRTFDSIDFETRREEGHGEGEGEGKAFSSIVPAEMGESTLRHWALYLDICNYVYEVTGEAMHFTTEAKDDIISKTSSL
jgi:hypothetical protein